MTALAVARRQVVWEQRVFWRNPAAAGFTFVFPLLFLVIFSAINGDGTVELPGGRVPFAQYYVPAILALGLVSACYMNLAFTLSIRRTSGLLKRVAATPVPSGGYFGGLVGSAIVLAAVLSGLILGLGVVAYDLVVPERYLGLAAAVVLGAGAFSALGLAVASFVPNESAAQAMISLPLFPLLFISGTFSHVNDDSWLARIASVFPVRHLNKLTEAVFNPHATGNGLIGSHVAVLVAWGIVGVVVAHRRLRHHPVT